MKFLKYLALIIVTSCSPAYAGVVYDANTKSATITGPTNIKLHVDVISTLRNNNVETVFMWGNGGEYYRGLDIGRAIRESGARIIIPSGKRCISACAFSAIGSKKLIIDGELLFHKPFALAVSTMDRVEDIVTKHGGAYMDMAIYLNEMGYDLSFAKDIITKTSPCLFMVMTDGKEIGMEDNCRDLAR